ncbi:MAG: hypothetical protein R3B13_40835 [Polyangiaceae bacterium]
MKTVYSFELRVVTCHDCGAPVSVGTAGGRHACQHCGAAQQVESSSRAIPRAETLPEVERLALLRSQDRGHVGVPQHLEHLFAGLKLLPWKVVEALGHWKRLKDDDAARSQYQGARALQRLTVALADHFQAEGDLMRARSLLETALDATTHAGFRQMLCAALSRSACHAGDIEAAESWLLACDPTPRELDADTAHRFARATLDTRLGRFQAVVQVLGVSAEAVPIHDEHEAPCTALRANALERLGNVEAARAAVDGFMQRGAAFERYLFAEYTDSAPEPLCPQSGKWAEQQQAARGMRRAGLTAGRGGVALTIGLVFAGIGLLVGIIFAVLDMYGAALLATGSGGFFVAVFGVIAAVDLQKSAVARRLRRTGVPAPAKVVHARGTGVHTMGVPQLLYRVLVLPPSGSPFLAHSMLHADGETRQRLLPGALVMVRMDPAKRGQVLLELD